MKQLTPNEINTLSDNILRTGRIEHDFRQEHVNKRFQIVCEKPYSLYHLIEKQNGQTLEITTAQNCITLLCMLGKHITG